MPCHARPSAACRLPQVDYMLCEENYFLWDDPLFEPLWALLGEYNPYYLHGYLSRLLFQPTAELERDIDTLWRTQVGGRKVCDPI